MAKCTKCGRKGLFLKLNARGLCADCAALEQRRQTLADLEQKTRETEERAKRADELLRQAMSEATTQAHIELEKRDAALREQLDEMDRLIVCKTSHIQELNDQEDALTRKVSSAEKRISKLQRLYDSVKYALDAFETAKSVTDVSPYDVCGAQLDGLDEFAPDLKCLSVKNLRALYKKNEQTIRQVTESYQSQYTTKANAAIYKLMVMALNAELTNILRDLKFGKLDESVNRVKAMTSQYYLLASEGNQTIAPTLRKFIGQIEYLYIEAVKIEYEYYTQQERIKEEQRALREQMRQEAEERKQLEQQRKQVENEEKKYVQEMTRVKEQLAAAQESPEMQRLRDRLAELEAQLNRVESRKEEIINLQNGKAGTVYVISNIGSFGENVYKVGMTRRLEPQERIDELSNASVPFPFDVHSFIFSEDAVSLENQLHKALNNRRVNKINLRKEFFNVSIDEIRAMVEQIDPTAPFTETALADQYRQSLSMAAPAPELAPESGADEDEAAS